MEIVCAIQDKRNCEEYNDFAFQLNGAVCNRSVQSRQRVISLSGTCRTLWRSLRKLGLVSESDADSLAQEMASVIGPDDVGK
jgi:hypothetical protein